MTENILIVGALSGMARAIGDELAGRGHSLMLAARDQEELARTAADLRVRHGVAIETASYEALDFDSHSALLDTADRAFASGLTRIAHRPVADFVRSRAATESSVRNSHEFRYTDCRNASSAGAQSGLTGIVFCVGWMAEQELAAADFNVARRMIEINYTAAVSLLNAAANLFERRRSGWICALSSVAGDRGRQSNYLYGATKSALSAYLQGLRNRLTPAGVAVITVKPGCVDTAMTYGVDKLPFLVSPQVVARDVARAIVRRDSVVYTPRIWWPVMTAIRLMPEAIFRRLKL